MTKISAIILRCVYSYIFCLFFFVATLSSAQQTTNNTNSNKSPYPVFHHYAGKLSLGFITAFGYNVINHVDGTLAVIPNNPDPHPSPGTPVYSNLLSLNIDAPLLSLEYWFSPSWSLKTETGLNIMMIGASHALADFAYILGYWKINAGARYYFAKQDVDWVFLGLGWFADFPLMSPLIGFIGSDAKARITTGPYVEVGINYPLTPTVNLEGFLRFSFAIRALTLKSDPGILSTIAVSPLTVGFGVNWTIL